MRLTPPSPHPFRVELGVALVAFACLVVTAACSTTTEPPPRLGFADCLQQGREALAADDVARAKGLFELAVQRNPQHPYPHFYLGVVNTEMGEQDTAIVAFRRALELEPNLHEALYNLGTLHLDRREIPAAIEHLERAVTLDPNHVPTYNNLGKAYFLAGLPELAGAAYEEALARDPGNQIALENLTLLAHAAGDSEAEEMYRSRLRLRPGP